MNTQQVLLAGVLLISCTFPTLASAQGRGSRIRQGLSNQVESQYYTTPRGGSLTQQSGYKGGYRNEFVTPRGGSYVDAQGPRGAARSDFTRARAKTPGVIRDSFTCLPRERRSGQCR